MDRRGFIRATAVGIMAAVARPSVAGASERAGGEPQPEARTARGFLREIEPDEWTISELQEAQRSGRLTARALVEMYLERIERVDRQGPAINSVIEVNPDALAVAEALDRERSEKGARGPLHGVPILIKDNIDTADRMMTTAGSLAMVGSKPPRDAFIVSKLREAGAVILGKTNLSEWANFRSIHSTSGWSARGGQTKNPYALDRNPCGSSSGSGAAAAANLCAAAVGTETDGSIVCPSSSNSVVGIKPTLGLVSRAGIIPIAHSQDTAGPMARTVADAAVLLGALAGRDPRDSATGSPPSTTPSDYSRFLAQDGLQGARLGVVRKSFGFNDAVDRLLNGLIDDMKKLGADVVDPADIPTAGMFDDSELELFLRAEAKGPLTEKGYLKALRRNRSLARDKGIDLVPRKHRLDALVAPTGGPAWTTDPPIGRKSPSAGVGMLAEGSDMTPLLTSRSGNAA